MPEKKELPIADKKQGGCGCGCIAATQKKPKAVKPETDKPTQ
jgi:hypothetical protein